MEEIEFDGGYKFSFDERDTNISAGTLPKDWVTAEWNGITQQYINRYDVKPDWNIVIAGGWIGMDTVVFSKKAKMVYTLEPDPDSYKKLVMNCKKNNVHNVTLLQNGFSNKNQIESFNLTDGAGASGVDINYWQNKVIDKITIESITWDTLITRYNIEQVDLGIIDIEGAEERFLEGMTKCLPKRLFMSIYHPSSNWGHLREMVRKKGYHLVPPHIVLDGGKGITHSEVNEL